MGWLDVQGCAGRGKEAQGGAATHCAAAPGLTCRGVAEGRADHGGGMCRLPCMVSVSLTLHTAKGGSLHACAPRAHAPNHTQGACAQSPAGSSRPLAPLLPHPQRLSPPPNKHSTQYCAACITAAHEFMGLIGGQVARGQLGRQACGAVAAMRPCGQA